MTTTPNPAVGRRSVLRMMAAAAAVPALVSTGTAAVAAAAPRAGTRAGHTFVSRPDLNPPQVEISTPAAGVEPGYVLLTPAGYQVLVAAAPGHVTQVRASFLDALAPGQLEQLDAICDAILDRIDPDGLMTAR